VWQGGGRAEFLRYPAQAESRVISFSPSINRDVSMKNCLKCNGELIDGLKVWASGAYPVSISYKKRVMHAAKVQATLCPACGDVSLHLDKDAVAVILSDIEKGTATS
jgi:hypothetical protein